MFYLPPASSPTHGAAIGPIVGGIVGGTLVVVCFIVIVVIALLLLRRQKSDEHNEDVVEMSGLQVRPLNSVYRVRTLPLLRETTVS